MEFVNVNGKILEKEKAAIPFDDHSYRYGDGLFETMKIVNGKILYRDLHFERLFDGLNLLQFRLPDFFFKEKLQTEISELCMLNQCENLARVRLSTSRGKGGLFDNEDLNYIIEVSSVTTEENEMCLVIDIFPDARKSCDKFSNLKSANFLPYVMAARFAKENNLDDCLVLNTYERICDATIANIFWIKDEEIFTPPLSEGCVAGVKRHYLMERLQDTRYKIQERKCELNDLKNCDEIFLTNVVRGMRSVKKFSHRMLRDDVTEKLKKFLQN